MQQLPAALSGLSVYKQFVLWKPVPSRTRPGKKDKFPCNMAGEVVTAHDDKNWMSFDEVNLACQLLGEPYGIGFVFTPKDDLFFLDIDECVINGDWSPLAKQIMAQFNGVAIEVSQSGTGLHLIGRYTGTEPEHRCKNIPLHLELYTSGRFVALTGNHAVGNVTFDATTALTAVIPSHFAPDAPVEGIAPGWTVTHVPESTPIEDDDTLIAKAIASGNNSAAAAFGGGGKATFNDLWTANAEVLGEAYPDPTRPYDASSADAALASHLMFWTGGNCERVERLMRKSALARDKWDEHKKYLAEFTITNARKRAVTFYSVPSAPVEHNDAVPGDAMAMVSQAEYKEGYQFMTLDGQIEFFKGCVYVAEIDRIFTPNGVSLKTSQFNSMYGGYVFNLDKTGERTTKKAWEAFTESQGITFPKADGFCFRPKLPAGNLIMEEGRRMVNTFVPIDIDMAPGNIEPFLNHLRKVLPNERDQTILLSYMAACVQYVGYKIQWAPLLQGTEGNGKTLFTRCVAYALGRRYTHFPKASKIDSEFNGWLLSKLFIGVEDIYVPENRREILETLKPMITGGDGLEIQFKGVDQITRDVCCNFMLNSNHKNAIRKTLRDRRYCVFYSAQQEKSDIVRDGMSGNYFPDLYKWLRAEGYRHVAYFLATYPIPVEFNPTGICQTAPDTSSTADAILMGLDSVEQEIMEAIDEGRSGFANGWVSSFALDKLIDDMRKSSQVPRNRRRELMRSLDYDWHPGLKEGRVNNVMMFEDGKPRLFIKNGHPDTKLTNAAEIARAYMMAQGYLQQGVN